MAGHSEVAALVAAIRAEYDAGEAALYGLASGVSQHAVITARMERMGQAWSKLEETVGEEAAKPFIIAAFGGTKPS
jgi:hypothetical protein